jgi:hypothetical protein
MLAENDLPLLLSLGTEPRPKFLSSQTPFSFCTYTSGESGGESENHVNLWSPSSHPNRNGSPFDTPFELFSVFRSTRYYPK